MNTTPYPCIFCEKPVRQRQEGLLCEKCDRWQHRVCNTGVSRAQYRQAVHGLTTIEWECRDCANNTTDMCRASSTSSKGERQPVYESQSGLSLQKDMISSSSQDNDVIHKEPSGLNLQQDMISSSSQNIDAVPKEPASMTSSNAGECFTDDVVDLSDSVESQCQVSVTSSSPAEENVRSTYRPKYQSSPSSISTGNSPTVDVGTNEILSPDVISIANSVSPILHDYTEGGIKNPILIFDESSEKEKGVECTALRFDESSDAGRLILREPQLLSSPQDIFAEHAFSLEDLIGLSDSSSEAITQE